MVKLNSFSELLDKIRNKQGQTSVIGMGYIGLPTALHFAKYGIKVNGIDLDEKLVSDLKIGKLSMLEEGLDELAAEFLPKMEIGTDYNLSAESDICILCLPSPIDETKHTDLSYLEGSVKQLARVRKRGTLIMVASTIPIGTTEYLASLYAEVNGMEIDRDFWFAHSPERVLPGNVVKEMDTNHRLVGGVTPASTELATAFLRTIFKAEQVHPTSSRISEASKLAENSFRDVNISFANELAKICYHSSIDVSEVIRLANLHPRVSILQPGLGVGGYCLTKDGWILINNLEKMEGIAELIPTARRINDSMPYFAFSRIEKVVQELGDGDIGIGILGLSFKPNVTDTRNSPSLTLLSILEEKGYRTLIFDPLVKHETKSETVSTIKELIEKCGILILGVGHSEILKELNNFNLSEKIIFDPWNLVRNISDRVKRYVGLTIEDSSP